MLVDRSVPTSVWCISMVYHHLCRNVGPTVEYYLGESGCISSFISDELADKFVLRVSQLFRAKILVTPGEVFHQVAQ